MDPFKSEIIKKVSCYLSLGETVSKIKVGEPIISLHLSDFRTKGSIQLLCVCKTSTVKAYNLEEQ